MLSQKIDEVFFRSDLKEDLGHLVRLREVFVHDFEAGLQAALRRLEPLVNILLEQRFVEVFVAFVINLGADL